MSNETTFNLLRGLEDRPALPDAEIEFRSGSRPLSRTALVVLLDAAMLLVAAVVAGSVATAVAQVTQPPLAWVAGFSALVLVLLARRGLYEERGLRPHLIEQARTIVSVTAVATMAVITARVVLADDPSAAAQVVSAWVFATLFLVVGRAFLLRPVQIRARRDGGRPTLIVGAGKVGHMVARRLVQRPEFGLRPVGFLDNDPIEMNGEGVPLPLLGASWDLEYVIADRDVEHVIIAFSTAPHDVMLSMVRRCQKLGVTVSHVPRLFEASVERHTIEHLGGLPIVTAHPADPEGWQFIAKHAIDRVVAALALLILSPVLIGLAIATKLSTGGPVLFRQSRVGRDGIEFDMLKFRTMRGSPNRHGESDADWAAEILGTGNGNASHSIPPPPLRRRSLQPGREPEDRRTRLGRFMRRCSLDELPQIWNVARGDMSLVGPRPERIGYVRRFEHKVHRYSDRHRVKSGITGWAQVNGLRGKTSLPDRVEWDNYYIENWSLWLDFKIALLTVGAFFRSTE